MASNDTLDQRFESSHGRVAFDVVGSGDPLVLIHGTPSSSYLWRNVSESLSKHWSVYLFDLVGFGQSERCEGQDVSLKAQGEAFSELLDHWNLDSVNVVGHDYGAGTLLRAHLLHGHEYRAMAILDGVVREPWVTPFSQQVRAHVGVFQAVPEHIHRQLVIGHIRSAIHRGIEEEALEPYLEPWLGEEGQPAYYRQVAQFDEQYTDEIESDYPSISIPTLIAWGEQDEWISIETGRWLHEQIPESTFETIPNAGHFAPEDNPARVARVLDEFFQREF